MEKLSLIDSGSMRALQLKQDCSVYFGTKKIEFRRCVSSSNKEGTNSLSKFYLFARKANNMENPFFSNTRLEAN